MKTQLKNIEFKEEYRTDVGNIVDDFYIPALSACSLYRRAVGYFTSNSIHLAMQGISELIANGGKMQLIASPNLAEEDIQAINKGYKTRQEIVASAIAKAIPEEPAPTLASSQWEVLAWMVAQGTLDIKIAIPAAEKLSGLYHEKLGIFSDASGSYVAFSGSANETSGGLLSNFETIDVFTSWRDGSRTKRKIENFERLWDNQTATLEVIPFPEACRIKVLQHLPKRLRILKPSQRPVPVNTFAIPEEKPLREYQVKAIKNWLSNHGRGVLQMATGSGKTITGLACAQKIFSSGHLDALIVVCPYIHLVTQWDIECRSFGLKPILCYKKTSNWLPFLNSGLASKVHLNEIPLTVIVTQTTFASDSFQTRIKHFPKKTMILADEVHNMGASGVRTFLPEQISFRLGLSATPERWYDEEGTTSLYSYFGKILEPIFTLKDALDAGALCKYSYHPILIPLNEEEAREYRVLSALIARASGSGIEHKGSRAEKLLIKRARLIATAEGKQTALELLMRKRPEFSHHLFYCGDGTIETDDGEMSKHADVIIDILSKRLGARVAKFTAENSSEERSALLAAFQKGDLQGLVAIRCLDEGVDVPSIKTAVILASSTNPRQFIQRRGRILRKSPGKKAAEIFDMIVYPPFSDVNSASERSLVKKEMRRYSEFAELASNAPEAKRILWKLQEHFHITDM
jgi:DNA phosphorothioation system restriction enzyme